MHVHGPEAHVAESADRNSEPIYGHALGGVP